MPGSEYGVVVLRVNEKAGHGEVGEVAGTVLPIAARLPVRIFTWSVGGHFATS
jgi:hypothetical protein